MKKILLDVDGVLANFVGKYLHEVNSRLNTTYTHQDVNNFSIEKSLDIAHIKHEIQAEICKPGWCYSLELLPNAQESVKELKQLGRLVILTSNMTTPNWTFERTNWLKDHFDISRLELIFAKSKYLIHGDYLIDDSTENCEKYSEEHPHSTVCLIDQPWNQDCKESSNLIRFKTLSDVVSFIGRL